MVAPQVVGTATTYSSAVSGATVVLDKPTVGVTIQNGDVVVALCRTSGSTSATDFACSGFTHRGYTFVANDSAGRVTSFFTHVVTDATSEPSSYTFTKAASDLRRAGLMFVVRGADVTDLIAGNSSGWDASPSPRIQLNSFSAPVTTDSLLVYGWGTELTATNSATPTITPGTAVGLAISSGADNTAVVRTAAWVGVEPISASPTGNKSLTWSSAAGAAASGFVIRGLAGVSGSATGSLTVAGSATSSVGVDRSAAGSLSVSGAATRSIGVAGEGTGGLTVSGSTVLSVAVSRTAVGALTLSGVGVPAGGVSRTASGGLVLAGVTDLVVDVTRAADAGLTLTGAATPVVGVSRTAVGVLELSGTGFFSRDIPDERTLTPVTVAHVLTALSVSRTLEDA